MHYIVLLAACFFALCCAIMANGKNRNSALWACLGAALGLFAFIALAVMPTLCAYCSHNFSKGSNGAGCGHCGKLDYLTQEELETLEEMKQQIAEQGGTLKVNGVKLTLVQNTGARLKFVGVEALQGHLQKS